MYSALIVAVGEDEKMNSSVPKALHEVCFKSMICWVLDAVSNAQEKIVAVHGGADSIKNALNDSVKLVQYDNAFTHQLIRDMGCVLVIGVNTPLITNDTINAAYRFHKSSGNSATILTAHASGTLECDRVLRSSSKDVEKIVRNQNVTADKKEAIEINSLIYFFESHALASAFEKAADKYDFIGIIEALIKEKVKVGAFAVHDNSEISGINDRAELSAANEVMRKRIINRHMINGVTFISPETAYISGDAFIGRDTIIMPNTIIEGKTQIGTDCVIGPNSRIATSHIGCAVQVDNSVVLSSQIDNAAHIGPFAYIRPNCQIGKSTKIGDFVEIKNSVIKDGTKASHLTYIGDADVGSNVNFGCGTIIVNFDGSKKHRTSIGNNAFIGCNTNLVSPVKVGEDVFIAAGSTITDDIPDKAFAIARERQTIKTNWRKK